MFSLPNDVNFNFHRELFAVRCPITVTFTVYAAYDGRRLAKTLLITTTIFADEQSCAICEWKWQNRIVGSSVAKRLTSLHRLVCTVMMCK